MLPVIHNNLVNYNLLLKIIAHNILAYQNSMHLEDTVLAVVCFVCFAVGIPTNIVALRYFWRQARNITTIIYIVVAALDTFTSIMVFPVGKSSFKYL